MRTRVIADELYVHLDMQETEELEETGYVIATDMEDDDFRLCITYSVEDLNKEYEVWISATEHNYLSWRLKLSYTPEQEEEEINYAG